MRKITIFCCLLLLTLPFGHRTPAQDAGNAPQAAKAQDTAKPPAPPVHYYHLDFVVEEVGSDGKPVNSRTYSTTVNTSSPRGGMSIRTGSRIPISTGSFNDGKTQNMQFQYENVGVYIDVGEAHEIDRELALNVSTELTSLAAAADPDTRQPVIRENKWQAPILIPIGKPSVVFTSDSLDSKGSTRVVVTATLLQ
jgi:hypothetical protein